MSFTGNEAAFSKDSIDSRSNSPLPLQISEDYDLMPLDSEDVAVGSSENRKENEIFRQITDPTLCSEVSRQNIATSEDVSVLDSEDSPSVSSSVLPTSLQDSTVSSSTSLIKRGRVYSRVPPGPHMSLTGSAGKRVYLKICSEEALEISSKKVTYFLPILIALLYYVDCVRCFDSYHSVRNNGQHSDIV